MHPFPSARQAARSRARITLAVWAAFFAAAFPAAAAPGNGPAQAALPAVVIKDLTVRPGLIPNDGTGFLDVACFLFAPGDAAGVSAAWLDLSRTPLGGKILLSPDPNGTLPTGEGRFTARVPIPFLMDTGGYRLPVKATDTTGGSASRDLGFSVSFVRPPDLPGPGSEGFWKLLESLTGVPALPGNRVEVLDRPRPALDRRLSLIREARKQVSLESYSLVRDEAGGAILDALVAKADRGVAVQVLLNADSQIPLSPMGTLRLAWNHVLSEWDGLMEEKAQAGSLAESLAQFLGKGAGQGGGIHLVLFEGPPEDDEIRAESPPYWLSDLTRQQADPTAPAATPDEGPGLSGLPLLDYAVHEKILVADGKQAVVGGRNLEDRYFSRWLDVDLFLEGPVVAQVCQGFSGSFSQAAGWAGHQRRTGEACPETGAAGDSRAAFVRSRPWEGDFSTMTALALAVSCSRDRIWCGSQYVILPRGVLADALKDAAQRGVDVRIFTNSLETTSQVAMGAAWLASVPYLDELLKAGVRIFELKARPDPDAPQPYYHAKEFLFDGRVLAVGSHNLSLRSAYVESENLVFVGDETLCAQREEAFLRLVGQRARELTLERLAGIREEYKGRISLAKKIELLF